MKFGLTIIELPRYIYHTAPLSTTMSLEGMLCTNTHPQSSISFVSYVTLECNQYSHEVMVYHAPKLDVII